MGKKGQKRFQYQYVTTVEMKPHEMAPNRSKTDRKHKKINKGLKQRYLLKMNDSSIFCFFMRGAYFSHTNPYIYVMTMIRD